MRLCYDAIVRTTLDIADDAYQIAKAMAREQGRSLGAVVSDLIRGEKAGTDSGTIKHENFFPTFSSRRRTTVEDVKALEDEE